MRSKRVHLGLGAVLTAATILSGIAVAPAASAHPVDPSVPTADYAKLALAFEPNRGQSAAPVDFLARGRGYSLFLTPAEAVLVQSNASTSNADAPEHVL